MPVVSRAPLLGYVSSSLQQHNTFTVNGLSASSQLPSARLPFEVSKSLQQRRFSARRTVTVAAVQTIFVVPSCPLEFGQSFKVVGSDPLGNWEVSSGVALKWSEGDTWKGTVQVPDGVANLEFKLVKTAGDDYCEWEDGSNRQISIQKGATAAEIVCARWGDASATEVKINQKESAAATAAKKTSASSSSTKKRTTKKSITKTESTVSIAEPAVAAAPVVSAVAEAPAVVAVADEPAVVAVAEAPAETEHRPEPTHQDSSPSSTSTSTSTTTNDNNDNNGAAATKSVVPSTFATVVTEAVQGSDGVLIITFGDNAGSIDAATLAAQLSKK